MRPNLHYRSSIAAALTFVIGMVLIVILFRIVQDLERQSTYQEFSQAAHIRFLDIQGDFEESINAVYGLNSLFAVVKSVSREQFATFSAPLLARYPYIWSLNYRVFLHHSGRAAFEAEMRRTYPNFTTITDRGARDELIPAPAHPEYLVTYYVQPHHGNEQVIGFNSLSNKNIFAALERARDTGLPSASPHIRLIVGRADQQGFLIFLPVYRFRARLENVEQRRRNLTGYVAVVLRAGEMINQILQGQSSGLTDHQQMNVRVYDAPTADEKSLLFGPAVLSGGSDNSIQQISKTIQVAGRPWHLVATRAVEKNFMTGHGSWFLLIAGLLVSLLLAAYVYILTAQPLKIQSLVDQRTQALRQFVADVAHEVRTPLSALQLQLQLFERSDDAEQKNTALNEVKRGLQRTIHLVQQLLIFARLEPEVISASFSRLKLDTLVKNIIIEQTTLASTKRIDLGMIEDEPSLVMGDENLLRILLGNLIDNAIRYTQVNGKVDVAVWCNANQQVIVDITDTGPGIPEEDLPLVFHRFYRVPGRSATGSGLGLGIARRIAQLHRGSIELINITATGGLRARLILPRIDSDV